MSEPATSIYQLKVVLRHVTPLVWRRVLVRSHTTIAQLHRIVQVTMGWEDGHLHRFRIHGRDYSSNGGGALASDPRSVILASFRLRPSERFAYLYDFSAGWHHDIRLEQILALDQCRRYPVCIGGKHACPPEDSSGPDDYRRRLQERGSLAAFHDLTRVADFVGRWLDHDVRGTEDEQSDVAAALERIAERRRLAPDRFDRRAVNTALAHLAISATD